MLVFITLFIGFYLLLNSILLFYLKKQGYQIHHEYWLTEKENIWCNELEQHFEKMYAEEYNNMLLEQDNLKEGNKYMEGLLRKSIVKQKEIYMRFFHFFALLVEDSTLDCFNKRFLNVEETKNYYNSCLKKVLIIVEEEMKLKGNSKKSFAKKMFEKRFKNLSLNNVYSKFLG